MNKRSLKIAFFHFGFFYEGGGERLVLKQIEELQERGHEVVCFTPILKKSSCYPDWIGNFKIEVLVPQWLNWSGNGLVIEMLLASLLIIFQFWRFLKFDVLVGVAQPGAWMAFCLSKILSKPYLVWLNQPTRFLHPRKVDQREGVRVSDRIGIMVKILRIGPLKSIISFIDNISITRADVLMVISQTIRYKVQQSYKRKALLNYPGGGLDFLKKNFSLTSYKKRLKGNLCLKRKLITKPFILVTNRHFPQKRFEYAIGIMSFLFDKMPGLNLVITGRENNYSQGLKDLVYQLGLQQRVVFTGSVPEKDLIKLYLEAGVYLYTAPEEDFGMGVVESMSCGTPVVAWNEGGPKETIINNKTGYLAKPYNLSDFARKIEKILRNVNLMKKLGDNGRKRAKEFSYKKHLDTLEKYLIRLCEK